LPRRHGRPRRAGRPARIRELIEWGVKFTRQTGRRESTSTRGGHSRRRIFHAKDLTGREVDGRLVRAVRTQGSGSSRTTRRSTSSRGGSSPPSTSRGSTSGSAPTCWTGIPGAIHTFVADATVLAPAVRERCTVTRATPTSPRGRGPRWHTAAGDDRQHGIRPVPPHLPLPPRAKSFPHLEAVRGEGAILLNRAGKRSWRGPTRCGSSPRGTSSRGRSTPSEAHRARMRLSRHPVQGRRSSGSIPEHPRDVPLRSAST